ncbi:MAG: TolC family protein [Sandaracinaceae bacterium]|nr:TolC family protein [Sandaracinaceae bacterium]
MGLRLATIERALGVILVALLATSPTRAQREAPTAEATLVSPPTDAPIPTALSTMPPLAPMDTLAVGAGAPLALDEVIASVERHHPPLEAAEERVRAADGARLSAEGAFDLTLGTRGSTNVLGYYEYGRLDVSLSQPTPFWGATFVGGWRIGRGFARGGIPDYYRYDETFDAGELRLGVQVPLWRDGPIDARRATLWRAEHNVNATREDRDARQLRVRFAATESYARWVAAGQRYRVALALLSIAEERDAQIATRVRAGAIPAIEHLENRRAILERRQALVSARRLVEQRALALSIYLRDDDGNPLVVSPERLPGALETPGAPLGAEAEDVARALEERPELRRFAAQRRAAEVSVELAENQLSPRVDVSVLGSVDVGGPGVSDPERAYEIQRTLERPQLEASLTIQVPLQFRDARGRIEQSRAELAVLDAELELARDQIGVEVRDARSAIRAAEENVAITRQSAEVARLVADAERVRFDAGASSLLVVNLRESAAAAAAQAAIDADADLAIAQAAWLAATAVGE